MPELDRQVIATLDFLVSQYPVFAEGKPLAVGMREELLKRHPDIELRLLRAALLKHCKRPRYLKALAADPQRYDLDGNPNGAVTDEQREKAAADLEKHHEHEQAVLKRREEIKELERRAAERREQRAAREAARIEKAKRKALSKANRSGNAKPRSRPGGYPSRSEGGGAGTGGGNSRQQPVIIIKKKRPRWPSDQD